LISTSTDHRKNLNRLIAQRNHFLQQCSSEKEALVKSKSRIEHILSAQKLLQEVSEAVQCQVHQRIASVVTHCLKTVFGEDSYEFKLVFEQKRGKTEARPVFVKDGKEVEPLGSSGGGTVDVTAFALRLISLVLSEPKKRRLLDLDEPFKFLNGAEYQERVAGLLLALTKDFSLQMLIVTDDDWLCVGEVIRLD